MSALFVRKLAIALAAGAMLMLGSCSGEQGNNDLVGQIVQRYRDISYFDVLQSAYRSGRQVDRDTYEVTARVTVRIKFDCSELKTIGSFAKGRLKNSGNVADAISAYATNLQVSSLFGRSCHVGDTFDIASYALFEKAPGGWLLDFEIPTSATIYSGL